MIGSKHKYVLAGKGYGAASPERTFMNGAAFW